MPEQQKLNSGSIELICGSMFSGKTEELQRRLKRAKIAGYKTKIFKSAIDRRYHPSDIVSHDSNSMAAMSIDNASDILALLQDEKVIGIDEAQFFNEDILNVCNQLADSGYRVIVSGLETDYMGKPFGYMPQLMAIAEFVDKLHAICTGCGELAHYSMRLDSNNDQIHIGEKDRYQARCRACYNQDTKK